MFYLQCLVHRSILRPLTQLLPHSPGGILGLTVKNLRLPPETSGAHLSLIPETLPGSEQGSMKVFGKGWYWAPSPWVSPEALQKSRWGSQCCSGLGLCMGLCPLQRPAWPTPFSEKAGDGDWRWVCREQSLCSPRHTTPPRFTFAPAGDSPPPPNALWQGSIWPL